MNKALVLSVPGTGSRFTVNFLMACLGYEKMSPEDLLHKPRYAPFCCLQHVNATPRFLKPLMKTEGLKTIIPLRSPVHQFLTRAGEAAHAQRVREESKTMWRRLKQLKDDFDYVFLPIEEDMDRAKRLMKVADHLDAVPDEMVFDEIVTHWAKVGSSGIKPHRVKYDKEGDVSVGGFNMGFLDEEMALYNEWIEEYQEKLDGST
jgi:hypothetical protein